MKTNKCNICKLFRNTDDSKIINRNGIPEDVFLKEGFCTAHKCEYNKTGLECSLEKCAYGIDEVYVDEHNSTIFDIKEYAKIQILKNGIKIVPGHHPNFKTKEDVDNWIKLIGYMINKSKSNSVDN